jgi:hypothetical protein
MFFFALQGKKEHTIHGKYHAAVHPERDEGQAKAAFSVSPGYFVLVNLTTRLFLLFAAV